MTTLYELTGEYQEAFHAMIEADMDEQAIADTLEGLQGAIEDKGRNVAAFFLGLQGDVDAMKEAEKRMATRRKALENRIEQMKDYLRSGMVKAGIKKISCPEFSVSIGKPSEVLEVTNEDLIPSTYFKPQAPKLDKTLLKKDLKAGSHFEGAQLVSGKPRLTIR